MSESPREPPMVEPAIPPRPPPWRTRKFLLISLVVACLVIAGIILWQELRPSESDQYVNRFRKAVAAGGTTLDETKRDFAKQPDKHSIAGKLAEDSDPKVREALLDMLTADAPKAQPKPVRWGAISETKHSPSELERDALNKLLGDPDDRVRLKAIQAISGLDPAYAFEEKLLSIARKGSLPERIVVAESMAHWDGQHGRLVFTDAEDPVEVRLAAFEGAKRWGWGDFANLSFAESLRKMLLEPDPRIRMAAIEAARHNQWGGNVPVWADAIKGGTIEEKKKAYAMWIERLVDGPEPPGNPSQTLTETAGSLLEDTLKEREVMAIGSFVLCRAAMEHARRIDNGTADPSEWPRRGSYIVTALLRIPRQIKMWQLTPEDSFTAWLPGDREESVPAARILRAFLIEQLREPIEWAAKYRQTDASDLTAGFRRFNDGLKVGQRLLLGQVLDRYQVGSVEMLKKYLDDPKAYIP